MKFEKLIGRMTVIEDHRVSCDRCGAFDFTYGSYFDEYACSSCGWIVRDDEKTAVLENRFKKAALKETSAPAHKQAADEQAQAEPAVYEKELLPNNLEYGIHDLRKAVIW